MNKNTNTNTNTNTKLNTIKNRNLLNSFSKLLLSLLILTPLSAFAQIEGETRPTNPRPDLSDSQERPQRGERRGAPSEIEIDDELIKEAFESKEEEVKELIQSFLDDLIEEKDRRDPDALKEALLDLAENNSARCEIQTLLFKVNDTPDLEKTECASSESSVSGVENKTTDIYVDVVTQSNQSADTEAEFCHECMENSNLNKVEGALDLDNLNEALKLSMTQEELDEHILKSQIDYMKNLDVDEVLNELTSSEKEEALELLSEDLSSDEKEELLESLLDSDDKLRESYSSNTTASNRGALESQSGQSNNPSVFGQQQQQQQQQQLFLLLQQQAQQSYLNPSSTYVNSPSVFSQNPYAYQNLGQTSSLNSFNQFDSLNNSFLPNLTSLGQTPLSQSLDTTNINLRPSIISTSQFLNMKTSPYNLLSNNQNGAFSFFNNYNLGLATQPTYPGTQFSQPGNTRLSQQGLFNFYQ